MDTLQIQIPEGHEVDTENSDLSKGIIKFKPKKSIRFIDDRNAFPEGYCVNDSGRIVQCASHVNWENWSLSFATIEQALSAKAFGKLSYIIANDPRFGGPVTDEEWKDASLVKVVIYREGNRIARGYLYSLYTFLAFHTDEQRNEFLKENEDLIKQYFML